MGAYLAFSQKPAVLIPFKLKGFSGKVAVEYRADSDPAAVGFDTLPGMVDPDLCLDYPVLHASVRSYGGMGYRALTGWIQVITAEGYMSEDDKEAESFETVDQLPAFQGLDLPFMSVGYPAEFFNAPAGSIGNYVKLRWTADTFLTTVPLLSQDEEVIERIASFRWGFIEIEGIPKPTIIPIEVTDEKAWLSKLNFLQESSPEWNFKK